MLLKLLRFLDVSQGGSLGASSSKTITKTYQGFIAQDIREIAAAEKLAFERMAEQEERLGKEENSERDDMDAVDDSTDADIEGTGFQADTVGGYTCRPGADDDLILEVTMRYVFFFFLIFCLCLQVLHIPA